MWLITKPKGHMLPVGLASYSHLLQNVKVKVILSSKVGEMSDNSQHHLES